MKKKLFFALFFAVCSLSGMDEMPEIKLNIADAVPDGCRALTETVIRYGAENEDSGVSVTCLDADNALRGLESGKFQLLLIDEARLPSGFKGKKFPAFADALAAYVHVGNPVRDISSEKLRKAWQSRRCQWKVFGGSAADIHRYAMLPGRPGGALIKEMLGLPPSSGVTMLNLLSEPLLFVEMDTEALALVRFRSEYPPESVKLLAVDGVRPSEKNIRDGSYRFSRRYVWVAPSEIAGETEKFLSFCRGEIFRRILKEEYLIVWE